MQGHRPAQKRLHKEGHSDAGPSNDLKPFFSGRMFGYKAIQHPKTFAMEGLHHWEMGMPKSERAAEGRLF